MPFAAILALGAGPGEVAAIRGFEIVGGVAIGLVALLHSRGSRTVFGIIYAIEMVAMFYAMTFPLSFYVTGWK